MLNNISVIPRFSGHPNRLWPVALTFHVSTSHWLSGPSSFFDPLTASPCALSPLTGSGPHVTAWRMVAAEEDVELISSKKRKLYSEVGGEVEPSPDNSASPAVSRTSGGFYEHEERSGDAAKKESLDLENVDLMSKGVEKEISTSTGRVFSRAAIPSEFYGDSEQVSLQSVSTAKSKNPSPPSISRRNIDTYSPPPAELEMFFAAAEKHDQKRFLEKYNYDIVRDVPLEGKYQWVRLHP
ncbi:Cyclin-dependent kinase inhibitor 7 [Striga hermonthica]|uniref:Cyclin-dependent kinase inhibitor 7 n=1 Tax=Striga hermonthica TaxID=68872 RepID=A0A9N7N9P9_STRHE|nr:Cyclin-dependent kinase inhibitor 7 [Striga hermonthica]